MKSVKFLGDSLKEIGQFPEGARRESGYQLRRLQEGKAPEDFKPIPEIGTRFRIAKLIRVPAPVQSQFHYPAAVGPPVERINVRPPP